MVDRGKFPRKLPPQILDRPAKPAKLVVSQRPLTPSGRYRHVPPQNRSRPRPIPFNERNRGGGATASQGRAIPWDCSDWQAFAHADRTTAILESLAENRGKTLYCGIDQSDTFAKAETWAAGKDRNERDDTIYSGERGIFRGFIAAQEGWLTEGESGVTGVSIDRIFEFPREERKRRTRIKRLKLAADSSRLVPSPIGPPINHSGTRASAELAAGITFNNSPPSFDWEQLTAATALAECRSRGYPRARNAASVSATEDWGYTPNRETSNPQTWIFEAYKTREYTATCEKKVRRARR